MTAEQDSNRTAPEAQSNASNGEGQAPGQQTTPPAGDSSQQGQGSWLETLPQEAQAEIRRLRGEAADYRTKARDYETKVREFEDRDKTEGQRAAERQQQLERENAELSAYRARVEVARQKGLPLEWADRLRGQSTEELEKDADELSKQLKQTQGDPGSRVPNFDAGARSAGTGASEDMSSLIRRAAGRA